MAGGASAGRFELTRSGGDVVRVRLPPELGASWREVTSVRLGVRTTDGSGSLARRPLPPSAELELELVSPGCSLVEADLAPAAAAAKARPLATHCAKVLLCRSSGDPERDRAARRDAAALVTAKTGSRIEIRPLFNPLQLAPGADLPVRLYFGGAAVAGATVTAHGPGGALVTAASDGVGIANLTIPDRGAWNLEFAHRGARAELIFDVPRD